MVRGALALATWAAVMASSTGWLVLIPAFSSSMVLQRAPRLVLSPAFSSSMVLQRAPRSARLFGTAAPGAVVTVSLSSKVSAHATAAGTGRWVVALPPQPAAVNVTLTVADGSGQLGQHGTGVVVLTDVAFGDVLFCTGQSNSACPIAPLPRLPRAHALAFPRASLVCLFASPFATPPSFIFVCHGVAAVAVEVGNGLMMNQSAEEAGAHLYDIRLMNNGVMWPPHGATPNETWVRANATTVSTFSNLCWLTGRDTYRALGGTVAVGLASSCVGGTGIEQWSSTATLDRCSSLWPMAPGLNSTRGRGSLPPPGNLSNCRLKSTVPPWEKTGPWCSGLYNQMIAPLAPMAFKAVLWYQGENNLCKLEEDGTANPLRCAAPLGATFYKCALAAMIEGWRGVFQPPPFDSTEPPLPFLLAELDGFAACHTAPHGPQCVPPQPPVCSACMPTSNFAALRQAQAEVATGALPGMPRFVAVIKTAVPTANFHAM